MQAAQERLERENQELPLEDQGQGLEREQNDLVAAETSVVASEEKGEKESETVKPIQDVSKSPSAVEPTPASEKGKVGSAAPSVVPISPQYHRQDATGGALDSSGQGVGAATPQVTQPQSSRDGMESVANRPDVGFAATPQTPLFTNEQLMQWRMLEEQAPLLLPRRLDMMYNMPLQRPQFMEFEEARLIEERRRHEELRQHVESLMMENRRLSKRVEELESRQVDAAEEYHTPDQKGIEPVSRRKEAADHQKDAADPQSKAVDPKERTKTFREGWEPMEGKLKAVSKSSRTVPGRLQTPQKLEVLRSQRHQEAVDPQKIRQRRLVDPQREALRAKVNSQRSHWSSWR